MPDIIDRAKQFAETAHGTQLYGTLPYVYHLERVAQVLVRFALHDPELMAAAWLHDVLEDTPTKYTTIKENFGKTVAELVYAVTDELGRNRRERHEKTWPKTLMLPDAITLKLADRIANVEHSIRLKDNGKFMMYADEHAEFRSALESAGGDPMLWMRLNALISNPNSVTIPA